MNDTLTGRCVYWDAPIHAEERDNRQFLVADHEHVEIGRTLYQVQTLMPLDANDSFMDKIGHLIARENA